MAMTSYTVIQVLSATDKTIHIVDVFETFSHDMGNVFFWTVLINSDAKESAAHVQRNACKKCIETNFPKSFIPKHDWKKQSSQTSGKWWSLS